MKLHLPSGLRKALLACLAIFTLPAALPTTVGSASGVAAVLLAVNSRAQAADYTITSQAEYTTHAASEADNATGRTWDINVEAENFYFQGSPGNTGSTDSVTNADLNFLRTLTVGNGFDNHGSTFNGRLTGDVGSDMIFKGWKANVTNTWQFNGDLSGFKGDIKSSTQGTINIVFGDGSQSNAGAIKQEGGTLNLTLNGQTMNNSEIAVNNLTLNGNITINTETVSAAGTTTFGASATLTLGADVQMHLTTLAADSSPLAKLTLNAGAGLELSNNSSSITAGKLELNGATTFNGGTIAITGETTINSGASLTLGANTKMNLTTFAGNSPTLTKLTLNAGSELGWDGSLTISELELSGADASLTMGITAGTQLSINMFTPGTNALTIYLTGVTAEMMEQGSYELFGTDGWQEVWANKISVEGIVDNGRAVKLGDNGKVVYIHEEVQELKWEAVSGVSLAWSNESQGGWSDNKEFHSGDNVIITSTAGGTKTATITGEVFTGTVTIGGTGAFTFAGAETGDALTVCGDADISANSTFNLGVELRKNLTVKNSTTVTFSSLLTLTGGTTLQLGDGAKVVFGNVGTLSKKGDGHVSFTREREGTATVEVGFASSSQTFNAAGCQFGDGILLHIRGISGEQDVWSNVRSLTVSGELVMEGKQVVLQGTNTINKLSVAEGSTLEKLCLDASHTATTIQTDGLTLSGDLDLRTGVLTVSEGDVNLGSGIMAHNTTDGGKLVVSSGNLTLDTGSADKAYVGGVNVSGKITKTGSATQTINGGTGDNQVLSAGEVDVQEGTLVMGQVTQSGEDAPVEVDMTVTEGLTVAEGSTFTWSGGTLTVGKAVDVAGQLEIRGHMVVNGGGNVNKLVANGGALEVGGGKLAIAAAEGSGLTSLKLGANAELKLGGSLNLTTSLSWGENAKLTLGDDGKQKIVLGEGFSLDTEGIGRNKLTVYLSGKYLSGFEKGENSFFDLDGVEWQKEWSALFAFETDGGAYYGKLRLDGNGYLTWERDGVQWDNNSSDNTWSNESDTEWYPVDGSGDKLAPDGQDVHFVDNRSSTNHKINIVEYVTPKNVTVESGSYTFSGEGGLNLSDTAVLAVGGYGKDAVLVLGTENENLPVIELHEKGSLEITKDGALTNEEDESATATTQIRFMGGTLRYSQQGLKNTDISAYVADTTEGSTESVRVEVAGTYTGGVTWGDRGKEITDNGGMTLVLGTGVVKSGEGQFTLAWKEDADATHVGELTVEGGTLTLDVAAGESTSTTLTGGAEVGEGGKLELKSSSTGTLGIQNVTGDGTLTLAEGNVSLSGENSVSAIEVGTGKQGSGVTVRITGEKSMGGENTTLTVNGGTIAAESAATVGAATVNVSGSINLEGKLTFSGNLIGSGTLKLGGGGSSEILGSVSDFNGALDTGDGGTWTLHGSGTVAAAVQGTGTLAAVTVSGEELLLAGTLTPGEGGLTVENSGGGTLTITSVADSTGGVTLDLDTGDKGGEIRLGAAGKSITLSDKTSVDGSGTIVLSNVNLPENFEKGQNTLFVDTAPVAAEAAVGYSMRAAATGGVVDVKGLSAGNLDGITVNKGGLLKGVTGTYTVGADAPLHLYFDANNWGEESSKEDLRAVIVGQKGGDFKLDFGSKDAQDLEFEFDSSILKFFAEHGADTPLWLRVLENGTWEGDMPGMTKDEKGKEQLDSRWNTWLYGAVKTVEYDKDGYVKLTGSTDNLYLVVKKDRKDFKSDPQESTNPEEVAYKQAVVVLDGQTLTLNWDGATDDGKTVVHNLVGGDKGTQLVVNNTNKTGDRLNLTLDNTYYKDIDLTKLPQDASSAQGQDTTFKGKITGEKGVDITKSGKGTLTVGDNYELKDGTTTLTEGSLALRGTENSMDALEFAYASAQDTANSAERGLLLESGNTKIGSVTESETNTVGNVVDVSRGATLTLIGESKLTGTSITGEGTLDIGTSETKGASLAMEGNAALDVGTVSLTGSTLDVGTVNGKVGSLNGDAGSTIMSAAGGTITVNGGSFSGTLGASENGGAGTLAVADDASFTLDHAKSTATQSSSGWGVQLGERSKLTVDVSGATDNTLVLGDVALGSGNMVVDFGSGDIRDDAVSANIVSTGKDGKLTFKSSGVVENGENVETGIKVSVGGSVDDFVRDHVEFTGFANFTKNHEVQVNEGGEIVVTTQDAPQNKYGEALMPGASKNARAGATMMWESLRNKTADPALVEALQNPDSDYVQLTGRLIGMYYEGGGNAPELERVLASVAGGSISTLGPALAEDLHRQLKDIRNRTTTMASEARYDGYDVLPLWHAWISGEGGYRKLDSDGYAPGYTLNNWGGTVGADVDLSRNVTVGLALSAMYGKLKPDAAESADGHLDTVYLSGFMRASRGAWIHTFVVSGGVTDVSLDRTVSYGSGVYQAKGDTNGFALGALYEVGYTAITNAKGTFALQPVFNVEVRHVGIKGYSESNSDAGLRVDDITQDVVTFGAGVRMQSVVGENLFNRTSVFEARALAKLDVGDRSGKVLSGIVGDSARAEVESAEVGAAGVEIGAGLSIPLGSRSGSIFMDASLEYRQGYMTTDASVGYRINF